MSIQIIKVSDGFQVNGKHVSAYGKHVPAANMQGLSHAERNALMAFIRSLNRVKIQSTIKTLEP